MTRSPKHDGPYPDRDIDCQEAIERGFQDLMENVMAAGWTAFEIAEAIESLAMADRLAREDVAAVDAQIEIGRVLASRRKA